VSGGRDDVNSNTRSANCVGPEYAFEVIVHGIVHIMVSAYLG